VAIPARAVHRRSVLGGLIHEYHQMAAVEPEYWTLGASRSPPPSS
jgi:hypothetical protein